MEIKILQEFIDRCNHGDLSAFPTVMEEYQGYAYAVAFRLICDEEDAKDIVQESFIRVWNNLSRYNPKVKFSTWLYTIVTNLCYDKLRARKRKQTVPMNEVNISMIAAADINENPEQLFSSKELASIIETLSEELPLKQKMIFVLRDLQGLNIQEVCEVLHLSKSSVKTNLVYARKHLRQKLEPFLAK
ncbi:MAG: RNA polymerase sigma factor [Bacteroidota bacterium]|nr:RNA polymerase sigma factor [Bacteroidota bacterium]